MNHLNSNKRYSLAFHGKGWDYFKVIIVNYILTILTFGLYYPWAKAADLKYLYSQTSLEGSRFVFSGTGKEMFKGFIKAFGIFILLYVILFASIRLQYPGVGLTIFYAGLFLLMPFAIHGSYKYRMSRSSWRGIRFGYRGDLKELIKMMFKGYFFSIFTFGIYSFWFSIDLRKYILGHIRFGDMKLSWNGEVWEFIKIFLKGYLLLFVTFGIYIFWFEKNLMNFYINHLEIKDKNNQKINFKSNIRGSKWLFISITNLLIIIFTFGLGFAWAMTRTLNFIISNIELTGNIDLDNIQQTEQEYKNAMGEDTADALDMDFIV